MVAVMMVHDRTQEKEHDQQTVQGEADDGKDMQTVDPAGKHGLLVGSGVAHEYWGNGVLSILTPSSAATLRVKVPINIL